VGNGIFLGVSHVPTASGRAPALPNLGVPFYLCTVEQTLCHRTTKFHTVTHMGRWLLFRWSTTPPPQGGGVLALPNFGAFHLFTRTPSDVVAYVGEERVSWGQPRLPSLKSGVPALPILGFSYIFACTSFNAERPNSAW